MHQVVQGLPRALKVKCKEERLVARISETEMDATEGPAGPSGDEEME